MRGTERRIDPDSIVRLVLGVARLGEADLAGWWSSHGLDRAGRYVLTRSFPRTWRSAALELDVLSAARRHEDALGGRPTALHLFSDELPFRRWAAAWLAEQKTVVNPNGLFDELVGWNLDEARRALGEWTGTTSAGEPVGDGLLLGRVTRHELEDPGSLGAMAQLLGAAYLSLDGGFRAPYFDEAG